MLFVLGFIVLLLTAESIIFDQTKVIPYIYSQVSVSLKRVGKSSRNE